LLAGEFDRQERGGVDIAAVLTQSNLNAAADAKRDWKAEAEEKKRIEAVDRQARRTVASREWWMAQDVPIEEIDELGRWVRRLPDGTEKASYAPV
jgi:hypothetical protein